MIVMKSLLPNSIFTTSVTEVVESFALTSNLYMGNKYS